MVFTVPSLVKKRIIELSFENSNRYVVKGVILHKILGEKYDEEENAEVKTQFTDQNVISLPLKNARKIFEKHYLQSQINRFDGNISKTATFIGMERSALHRKLKQLGLTEDTKK